MTSRPIVTLDDQARRADDFQGARKRAAVADRAGIGEYDAYLQRLHAGRATPASLIAAAVRAATGSEPLTTTRIIAGEVNEAYDVTIDHGDAVIVRASAQHGGLLLKERWAIDASRRAGVPVPVLLRTETVTVDGQPVTISVQRKLAGVSLDHRPVRSPQADRAYLKRITAAAGSILSRIHSVGTSGFGYLNASGEGKYQSRADILLKRVERREPSCAVLRRHGFDESIGTRAIEQVQRHITEVSEVEPRLVHGDYGPKHIFVDGEQITGIIDWGDAKSDDPVEDFAWWNYFYGATLPLAWLMEGYDNPMLFDASFARRLQIAQLCLGLAVLEYYDEQGFPSGVTAAANNLQTTLRARGRTQR